MGEGGIGKERGEYSTLQVKRHPVHFATKYPSSRVGTPRSYYTVQYAGRYSHGARILFYSIVLGWVSAVLYSTYSSVPRSLLRGSGRLDSSRAP